MILGAAADGSRGAGVASAEHVRRLVRRADIVDEDHVGRFLAAGAESNHADLAAPSPRLDGGQVPLVGFVRGDDEARRRQVRTAGRRPQPRASRWPKNRADRRHSGIPVALPRWPRHPPSRVANQADLPPSAFGEEEGWPTEYATGSDRAEAVPPLISAILDRGLRAMWIIGAVLLLAWIWEVDVNTMAVDTTWSRLLRGALHAVVILLVVELLWHILRTWIDRNLAEARGPGAADTPEALQKRARVRTLLPIARNVLFVVLVVMAALMALSAMGIEVGPLIAGAGVVGVAIGFGSQTLVKDVISGVFFLLDDAFRVGEYIESGSIRGTVEGFSLRSIKLRHHRGYLHTVPFGSLEKITNYSRDWVIDKATIGVTYDTDIDKVKRIIKQIGRDLVADPELAPHIIETLKMQGIEEYTDYAIRIRLKLTCKPGEQFVIRRRAFAMIKTAFSENGIKFAFPTVQVAGGEAGAAAAQAVLPAAGQPAG
mgnify:CR=1 FL=1